MDECLLSLPILSSLLTSLISLLTSSLLIHFFPHFSPPQPWRRCESCWTQWTSLSSYLPILSSFPSSLISLSHFFSLPLIPFSLPLLLQPWRRCESCWTPWASRTTSTAFAGSSRRSTAPAWTSTTTWRTGWSRSGGRSSRASVSTGWEYNSEPNTIFWMHFGAYYPNEHVYGTPHWTKAISYLTIYNAASYIYISGYVHILSGEPMVIGF